MRNHIDRNRYLTRRRKENLKRLYGMTLEEYDALAEQQDWLCAICSQPPETGKRLSVDHDHATDEVRGLLCRACNLFIGIAEENTQRLAQAIQYLQRHSSASSVVYYT